MMQWDILNNRQETAVLRHQQILILTPQLSRKFTFIYFLPALPAAWAGFSIFTDPGAGLLQGLEWWGGFCKWRHLLPGDTRAGKVLIFLGGVYDMLISGQSASEASGQQLQGHFQISHLLSRLGGQTCIYTLSASPEGQESLRAFGWILASNEIPLYLLYPPQTLRDGRRESTVSTLYISAANIESGQQIICRASNKAVPNGKETSVTVDIQRESIMPILRAPLPL